MILSIVKMFSSALLLGPLAPLRKPSSADRVPAQQRSTRPDGITLSASTRKPVILRRAPSAPPSYAVWASLTAGLALLLGFTHKLPKSTNCQNPPLARQTNFCYNCLGYFYEFFERELDKHEKLCHPKASKQASGAVRCYNYIAPQFCHAQFYTVKTGVLLPAGTCAAGSVFLF